MAGLVLWTGSVSSDRRTALPCIDVANAEVNSEQNYWQWHTDDKSVHIQGYAKDFHPKEFHEKEKKLKSSTFRFRRQNFHFR